MRLEVIAAVKAVDVDDNADLSELGLDKLVDTVLVGRARALADAAGTDARRGDFRRHGNILINNMVKKFEQNKADGERGGEGDKDKDKKLCEKCERLYFAT